MKIHSRAVHVGDRKRPASGPASIPSTTPIHTGTSYAYGDLADLDKVMGNELPGQSYARYNNPTTDALEELVADLEGGAGALACSSGMAALHIAIDTALIDRRRVILAAKLIYGATLGMLTKVFEPAGVEIVYADFDDPDAVATAIAEHRPSVIVMETIANPLLRVPALDKIGRMAREANVVLIVDNTFATPLITRPLEFGASMSTALPNTFRDMVTCSAASWSPATSTSLRCARWPAPSASISARSNRTWRCAVSRLSRCVWSGTVRTPAKSRPGWQRIQASSVSTSRRTRSIPTPRTSGASLPPVCTAAWLRLK